MTATRRRSSRSLAALLLVGLSCGAPAAASMLPAATQTAVAKKKKGKKKQKRPNIVLVMDDDQSAEMQRFLAKTNAAIGDRGVTFDNSYVSYSLCCPSRATYLTGQYAHNHGVRTNQLPSGGYGKLVPTGSNTLPAWLQRSGYVTAHIGKYLNGYGTSSPDTEVPPGWSEWYGSLDDPDAFTGGTYTAYGYTLNENGRIVHYGTTPDVIDAFSYQTDVYSQKATDFIRRRSPSRTPFYLSVAPRDPHSESAGTGAGLNNPRAALRYEGTQSGAVPPITPNFNEADVSDKPASIRTRPSLTPAQIAAVYARYRARAESLLGVDDLVQNVVNALQASGELKNTVLIFTSDNGFFHGEHRVAQGKVEVYEPSIRVPLMIRGPGVPKGKHRSQPVVNADLAPTILDFADAKAGRLVDGTSLLPLAKDKLNVPGRGIELETFFNADPDEDPDAPPLNYRAVRTDRYLYAQYGTGEQELYDLATDPFQLQSQHNNSAFAAARASLQRLLAALENCAGPGCLARPALKLKLSGGACGGTALLKGADADEVQSVRFYANGKKARKRIGAGSLSGSHNNRIEAVATMLDGRVTGVKTKLPAC